VRRFHRNQPSSRIRSRSQARSLHEDPPAYHVLCASCCCLRQLFRRYSCARLDVCEHFGLLHAWTKRWILVPIDRNFRLCIYDLGWCRSWEIVQRRKDLQPTSVVLLSRRGHTNPILLPCTSFPTLILAIRQHSRLLRWCWCYASCYWHQLLVMDHYRLHLPMVDASFPLPLVDALQLHPVRRPRRRCRNWSCHHLLHCAVPKEWDNRAEHNTNMVGKFCLAKNCRRCGHSIPRPEPWRDVRTFVMVLSSFGSDVD